MDTELNEPIHCHKCKKRTKNINPESVQTVTGRWRIVTLCSRCKTNKRKFIKSPEENLKVEYDVK